MPQAATSTRKRNRDGHLVLKESMSVKEILSAVGEGFPGVPIGFLCLPTPFFSGAKRDDLLIGELPSRKFVDGYANGYVELDREITLAKVVKQLQGKDQSKAFIHWVHPNFTEQTKHGCYLYMKE